MTGITIFENTKTHANILQLAEVYDPNINPKLISIDSTVYLITGFKDSFAGTDLTRYVFISEEDGQGGLNIGAGTP